MSDTTPRLFSEVPDFELRILPALRAQPFYREAPQAELDGPFAAYAERRFEALIDRWRTDAAPTRARIEGVWEAMYRQMGRLPHPVRASLYLQTLRAILAAGEGFRAGLRPEVRDALHRDFPWLEHRHEHLPAGPTPSFEFPPSFAAFLQAGELDDARARWQLAAALNEVQQASYSDFAAQRFALPELRRHAERERALALNYLRHWAPPVTAALFRQCVQILDGLNAAVFDMAMRRQGAAILARAAFSAWRGRKEWDAFVGGLDRPQRLQPLPAEAITG